MKSAVRGRISEAARGKLFVLIITNFVDMVGVLMIIPLLPYYARDLGAGSLEVAVIFGSFTAAVDGLARTSELMVEANLTPIGQAALLHQRAAQI